MCGRDYSTYTDEELSFRYLNRRRWPWPIGGAVPSFKPNYHMCPTQTGLVLSVFDGVLQFRQMRWGLVPAWAKTIKDAEKYSMINARGETITETRSYKAAFQKRRCVVPVSGFFEWKRSEKAKTPFAIYLRNSPIMSLAGVWEHWSHKDGTESLDSFAIITTAANSFMANIHDRMPVVLNERDEEQWLDPSISESAVLSPLLRSCPSDWLEGVEVSTLVNSPRNNSSELLRPATRAI